MFDLHTWVSLWNIQGEDIAFHTSKSYRQCWTNIHGCLCETYKERTLRILYTHLRVTDNVGLTYMGVSVKHTRRGHCILSVTAPASKSKGGKVGERDNFRGQGLNWDQKKWHNYAGSARKFDIFIPKSSRFASK